ncbi:MAG: PEP-CTERM sorting domain-containing protein, partial [Phycisphaerae bacterium]
MTLGTGEVDLAKIGTVVFPAGTVDGVRSLIHDGKLTATAGIGKYQAIGYLTGAQYNALHGGNTLGLSSTDLIAQYTWIGDTTLKGYLDASDFAQLDAAYLKHIYNGGTSDPKAAWINGDFNNDGAITAADFAALDAAWVYSHGSTLANDPFLAGNAALLGLSVADYTSVVTGQLAAAVPEPSVLGMLSLGALALLHRR